MDEKEKNISDVDMNTDNEQEVAEEVVNDEVVNDEIVNDEILEGENNFEAKLAEAETLAKENFDKYLRQVAEFENFRKRTTAEKASMYSNGVRDTVEKLLPVLDNFERAINATEDKDNTLYVGVEMILKQFNETLTALGVEEIPAEGEPFDPNLHNAVMHVEDDKCDTNVVVEVFQKGYKMGDKVIRHSMVKVAN